MRSVVVAFAVVGLASWSGAQETTRFFAGAASTPGANSTFFVTDARVFNPDPAAAITVNLAFLAANADNTGATEVPVTIGPRQGAALDDLVAEALGRSGAGGVRLRSSRPFLATCRTYNIGDGTSGTFGQFTPGLTAADALARSILLQVVNDPAASGFRTNVGFLNPGLAPVTVTYRVYDAATAALLGEGSRSLPPLAFSQVNNVFSAIGMADSVVRNATVEVAATAPVLAYASVVDNTSGDAIYVLPGADSGTPAPVNQPPDGTIVAPTGDVTVTVGQPVDFVATVSDPDGDPVTGLEWDFGDGVTASGLAVVHTYAEAGAYAVTFTATDAEGATDPTPATRVVEARAAGATLAQVQQDVFSASCAFSGCHGGSSPAQGLSLSPGQSWANTVNVPSRQQPSLDLVEPGDPEQSYLWRKVTGAPGISGARMPFGAAPLDPAQLDLLRSWVEAGALDN